MNKKRLSFSLLAMVFIISYAPCFAILPAGELPDLASDKAVAVLAVAAAPIVAPVIAAQSFNPLAGLMAAVVYYVIGHYYTSPEELMPGSPFPNKSLNKKNRWHNIEKANIEKSAHPQQGRIGGVRYAVTNYTNESIGYDPQEGKFFKCNDFGEKEYIETKFNF